MNVYLVHFKSRLELYGFNLDNTHTSWIGNASNYSVYCSEGHHLFIKPKNISGKLPFCPDCHSIEEGIKYLNKFREILLNEHDAMLDNNENIWHGNQAKYHVICSNGHHCYIRPMVIFRGDGPCHSCGLVKGFKNQGEVVFNRFKSKLAEYDAVLDESEKQWKGSHSKYIIICVNGHVSSISPVNVVNNSGKPCFQCAVEDRANTRKAISRERYIEYLSSINAIPNWEIWHGVGYPHEIICSKGHKCNTRPNDVMNGHRRGICSICAGNNTYESERKCKDRLSTLGATPMWTTWYGSQNKHQIMCKNGHICWVYPSNINYGIGPCRICANKEWDVFYLVHNSFTSSYKLGITSGDPNPRLTNHKVHGYTKLLFLVINIDAKAIEDDLLSILKLSDYRPIMGREYFDDESLEFLLSELSEYHLENIAEESSARK